MITISRILLVDDYAPFRCALREFLSHEPDFQIVGEAGSLGEAIQSIGTLFPHLVLTDLAMPDSHGIEVVTEIKRYYPDMKILVVSLQGEDEYKLRCREARAAGYVAKDAIHDELLDGMRTVLSGRIYLGAEAPNAMVSNHGVGSAASRADCCDSVH